MNLFISFDICYYFIKYTQPSTISNNRVYFRLRNDLSSFSPSGVFPIFCRNLNIIFIEISMNHWGLVGADGTTTMGLVILWILQVSLNSEILTGKASKKYRTHFFCN